jgi:GntR family transcriptional regulator
MWLDVDPRSQTPVYQQIVNGFKHARAAGLLATGDRVPSVRELSALLSLNHNTVTRAYQELERERVIEVLRGRGAFIAEPRTPPDQAERVAELAAQVRQLVVEAHHLQMGDEELIQLVRQAIDALRCERGRDRV